MTIDEIKQRRVLKGLSLRVLAGWAGCSHMHLHYCEIGDREPSAKLLRKLEQALRQKRNTRSSSTN